MRTRTGTGSDDTQLDLGPRPLDGLPRPTGPEADDLAGMLAALPPGCALLVMRRGPQAGARFLLDGDVTTAGRGARQDIMLDDATVSRTHAEFVRRDDGFVVRDLNSLNGTYVGGARVAEAVLRPGEVVQIGKFRLVYHPRPEVGRPRGRHRAEPVDDAEGATG